MRHIAREWKPGRQIWERKENGAEINLDKGEEVRGYALPCEREASDQERKEPFRTVLEPEISRCRPLSALKRYL